MSQVKALRRVIQHRLAELDGLILKSRDPRDVARLWRTRRRLVLIRRALLGPVK